MLILLIPEPSPEILLAIDVGGDRQCFVRARSLSSQQFLHHVAVDVRQPVAAALELVGQPFVVDT